MPKIFNPNLNVYEAAKARIRYVYSEFPNVIASFSGGKDSTVCIFLCLEVARELGRLPLTVMFIDQEAEWQSTIDYARILKANPDIDFRWLQVPIKIENATSNDSPWIHCWGHGEAWMRDKEPGSIQDDIYGDNFYGIFDSWLIQTYPLQKACFIGGIRCDESPVRLAGMTGTPTYPGNKPWITWGKRLHADQYHTFYPIYDWIFEDVWHYISINDLPYNRLYDNQYHYGIPINKMRCSSLMHETAIANLLYAQEYEPETWNKLCARLPGINAFGHIGADVQFANKNRDTLPPGFNDWHEYRDYLLEHLVSPESRQKMIAKFTYLDDKYAGLSELGKKRLMKQQIATILANDGNFTKLKNWERRPSVNVFRKWLKTGVIEENDRKYWQDIPKSAHISSLVGSTESSTGE